MRVKKKVLVIGYLPPPQEGTAKVTETIINSRLLQDSYEMQFLPLAKNKKTVERGKVSIKNVVSTIYNYLRLIYFILKFNPRIVYFPIAQNRFGFLRDSLIVLVSKIFGKKTCLHFHGGSFDEFYKRMEPVYKKYIVHTLNKVDKIIVLAERLKYQFERIIPDDRICVLFNPSPINAVKNKRFIKKEETVNLVFFGAVSKAKGALDIVKAIPLVKKEFSGEIKVSLCGQFVDVERNINFINNPDGGYSSILKIIMENNLDSEISLCGQVVGTQKDELFKNGDIFVFPSYSEGCPIAVMEAMAYGLPLIVTPVGALPEMLKEGKNCLFVEPGDYRSIAEKILYLARHSAIREEMGRNNIELIESRYNKDNFCIGLSEIWRNIN